MATSIRWLGFLLVCLVLLLASSAFGAPKAPRAMSNEELLAARRHLPLGGPIALVVLGGSLILVAAPIVALSPFTAGPEGATQLAAGVTLATVGGVTAISGGIWWDQRGKRRRALDDEIERRRLVLSDVRLAPVSLFGGAVMTVSGRF